MKVLILSCNTGEGHNAAGRAIYEKLTQWDVPCDFVDTLSVAGGKVSRAVDRIYVGITTSSPDTFGRMYAIGRKVSDFNTQRAHWKSPIYRANALYRGKLARIIAEGGYDVVVIPHLFPAECLTSLRKHGRLTVPFVNIATDYACIPFWEETSPDYFVIPHRELTEDFTSRGISEDILLPFGIPVRDCFRQKTEKAQARAQLGLSDDRTVLLLMSGSMGFGNLGGLTEALLRRFCGENPELLLLCGRNDTLREKLAERFGEDSRVRLMPFTDQVSLLMDAADMVFTKPGGLSSTEAAVKNTLLVHTAPIPGCETINACFFGRRGMSVSGSDAEQTAEAAFALWKNPEAQESMREAQRQNSLPYAADDICRFLLDHFDREGNVS